MAALRWRLCRWFYGRANRYPYGVRRRRLWALPAVVADPDFPLVRPKLLALRATRQPSWT